VEQQLRLSDERYRLLMEQSVDGIFVADAQGRYTDVNLAGCNMLGYGRDEILGRSIADVIVGDEIPRIEREVARLASGDVVRSEWRFRRKDGSVFVGEVIGRQLPDGRLQAFVRDITKRRQAEEATARLAAIVTSSSDAIVSKTLDGKVMSWNDGAVKLFGFSAEEMIGQSIRRLIPADRQEEEDFILARITAGQDIKHYETVRLHKDGRPIDVSVTVSCMRNAAGNIIGASKIARDITERKRATAAWLASEARFRGIYERARTGIAIMNLDGRFQSCNPAYSAMLGYTEEELRELICDGLIHPDDRTTNSVQQNRLLAGEISSFEIVSRYFSKEGNILWGHRHISLLYDAENRPANILALVTDITERKRHEEQISLLLREVNHRAKNMLALVQSVARQTAATEPQDFIGRFGERIQALAASQDLLVRNEWKGADLQELIRSQLAHFKDLIGNRIKLRGPSLFVSASAAQTFGMTVHELATNAGKYGALSSGDGRVGVNWGLERGEGGEENFVMSWREQGGSPVTTPSQAGFGSTVLVRMAKLSLDAQVELDYALSGLTWRLQCPIEKVLEGRGPAAIVKTSKPFSNSTGQNARPRILVVEDEALMALEIAQVLAEAGFDIVGPASAVAPALELVKHVGCDAAVLDINLGSETSEPVARELNHCGTPFVTLSGYSQDQLPRAFCSAPPLTKPLRPKLLVAELRRCLHRPSEERKADALPAF
jgi:PAS domain S-box-containing protein